MCGFGTPFYFVFLVIKGFGLNKICHRWLFRSIGRVSVGVIQSLEPLTHAYEVKHHNQLRHIKTRIQEKEQN